MRKCRKARPTPRTAFLPQKAPVRNKTASAANSRSMGGGQSPREQLASSVSSTWPTDTLFHLIYKLMVYKRGSSSLLSFAPLTKLNLPPRSKSIQRLNPHSQSKSTTSDFSPSSSLLKQCQESINT